MSNALSGIGANANAAQSTTPGNPYADLESGEFMKIMLTELQQQDPKKPNDTTAIMEQLSSLRNIESQSTLQDNLESLVEQNSITSGSALIGDYVTGLDAENNTIQGLVSSMKVEDGKPVLKLQDGQSLSADRVTEVQDANDMDPQVIQQLLASMRLLDSSAMIGKQVVGAGSDGESLSGQVTAIRAEEHQLTAELDTGRAIPVSSITRFAGND